ncbi:hypothetical protein H8S75_18270 [Hungatella sp. L12]|uniref:Uncharacterized protein n=1 Tax=Hungatella hominis TaxID=2763050 RepID=A0ABR7H9N6_9FIRM|nr:hypothetical protein [Hungatella hominis]MBC5709906.1 hypothetical protein [Hungatella hominis]
MPESWNFFRRWGWATSSWGSLSPLCRAARDSGWGIDLGPDGGDSGGRVMFEGTPEEMRLRGKSITAKYLQRDIPLRNDYR